MGATTSSSAESDGPDRRAGRYARETTTGSGGTHLGCRLGYAALGLRPRRARSASENRPGRQPKWVPLLLVVRSRGGLDRRACRYARETTTGSGGTHLGCRLGHVALGLRPRRARSASEEPSGSSVQMGATTSSSAESDCPDRRACRYARETTTGSGGTHLGCRLGGAALGLRPRRARGARASPLATASRRSLGTAPLRTRPWGGRTRGGCSRRARRRRRPPPSRAW